MRPFLTVLTAPIPGRTRLWYQTVRRWLRPVVRPNVPLPYASPYPGHFAVTRSAVEGLRAIGADFNFNPRTLHQLAPIVYAPANEALRQCFELKRRGVIKYLVAGPVNALHPRECDGILRHGEIDQVLVASEWVIDFFKSDAPEMTGKLRVCPSGVDAAWWRPSAAGAGRRIVVYQKNAPEELCTEAERAATSRGFETIRIDYGAYTREGYREALDGAAAAIFLSRFETQGLALAESWSMDVPTFVWNPRGMAEWRGRTFRAGSSAPFLTADTGAAWTRVDELEAALDRFQARRMSFRPRAWVVANMTDAVCAAALYRIIQDGVRGKAA